jgi:hypothetical protein
VLEGIPLPATRSALLAYARAQDPHAAALLEPLPDREYDRLDAVAEALSDAPRPPSRPSRLPWPESDKPPGGSAYLEREDSGAVRDSAPYTHPPEAIIEQQSALQKEQQERQQG